MDISVIVPFYQGNGYMEQLFACVRRNAQNAGGLQIQLVLVNDSPDCPIQYDEQWVKGFSLRIVNNPENVGIQRSRVNGLLHGEGEYAVLLDQDDLLADNALASQYRVGKGSDVTVANGYNENRDGNRPIYDSLAHQKQVTQPRFYYSVGCMIVSPGQCMIRKAAIPKVWYERAISCNGADDYFLWLLLLETNCKWAVNPDVLYTHVDTGENLSSNLDQMIRSSCEVLDQMKELGLLPPARERIAKRRFTMRRLYEGRGSWRKIAAMLRYPDLGWELIALMALKKCTR